MTKESWFFAKENKWLIILYSSMSILANIFYMMIPYVVGKFINTLQEGGDDLLENVFFYLIMYTLLPIIFWMLNGSARTIEKSLAFKITYYKTISNLPLSWHTDNHSGNIMKNY